MLSRTVMSGLVTVKLMLELPLLAMDVLALRMDNLYLAAFATGQKRRHACAQELNNHGKSLRDWYQPYVVVRPYCFATGGSDGYNLAHGESAMQPGG
ncbi:hypothetical protein EJB05_05525, partial [Eragrostis curvula]